MTRESLMCKSLKVLRVEEGKQYNIVGRHDMKKDELVDRILEAANSSEPTDSDITFESDAVTSEVVDDKIRKEIKEHYIENAEIGTIVAFSLPGMKAKSAKIIKKSTRNRKLLVETTYGLQFKILWDDVIWVKTNKRWPRGVYNELKGIKEQEV